MFKNMAEGKNKIVVYADWLGNFEDLTDEELGKLMRHFFEYVNDLNPVLEDRLLSIAWKPIQATLKRDLKKWETYVEKQKANGKKGGRPKAKEPKPLFENPLEPKKADSVSVSDRDNTTTEVDFVVVDGWLKEIGKSPTYLEGLYRLHKLQNGSISKLTNNFKEHLKVYPSKHSNFSEFKKHFASWLQIKNSKGDLSKYQKQTKGQL